jgi:hypothetical protein
MQMHARVSPRLECERTRHHNSNELSVIPDITSLEESINSIPFRPTPQMVKHQAVKAPRRLSRDGGLNLRCDLGNMGCALQILPGSYLDAVCCCRSPQSINVNSVDD